MATIDPSEPHLFSPGTYDSSICADCGAPYDDPIHSADSMAPQALDQLETGRLLVERARMSPADRDEYDALVAYLARADLSDGLFEAAAANPPNLAPYKIATRDGQIVVVNNAGEVKAKFGQDRDAALKYLRALYVNVPGAPGKAAKKKWSGKQKRAS